MKIGLTYTGTEEKHNNYVKWLQSSSAKPEIVTLSAEKNNLNELKDCDALVLSGGVDMHPEFYNSSSTEYPNAPEKGFQRERDLFEIAAFEFAQKNNLPVLGICRGMQLMNCALKGDLEQDIGKLNPRHKAENLVDKKHEIRVEPDSVLSEIADEGNFQVNSAHHQRIKKLSKDLKMNAIADDGTIEGVEWADKKGKPFLLGVQWHPERMYKFELQDSPLSKNLREHFISAIKQSMAAK